jgi:hypothetical protein
MVKGYSGTGDATKDRRRHWRLSGGREMGGERREEKKRLGREGLRRDGMPGRTQAPDI